MVKSLREQLNNYIKSSDEFDDEDCDFSDGFFCDDIDISSLDYVDDDDAMNFSLYDLLLDGYDDMDVLLAGLGVNLEEIKKGKSNLCLSNVDLLIAGEVTGQTVDDIFAELGLVKTDDGKVEFDSNDDWHEGNEAIIDGKSYMEFTSKAGEGVTILVSSKKLED